MDTNEMDDKLAHLKERVANYEASEEYQDNCWQTYRRFEIFVRELVKWRMVLDIEPGSSADKAISFFIHRIWQRHGSERWPYLMHRFLVSTTLSLDPGMYSTFLSVYVGKYTISMVEDLLAGKEDEHYVSRDRTYDRAYLTDWLKTLKKFDEKGPSYLKEKKIIPMVSPPIEFLPEWYYIARPTNRFYQEEDLEPEIEPVVTRKWAEDHPGSGLINELNEMLQKRTLPTKHVLKALEHLGNLGTYISGESKLRKEREAELDEDEIHVKDIGIKIILKAQRDCLDNMQKSLAKQTGVPVKELYDRMWAIVSELGSMVDGALQLVEE